MLWNLALAAFLLLLTHIIIKFFVRPLFLLRYYKSQGLKTFYFPVIGEGYEVAKGTALKDDCYHHIKVLAKNDPKLKAYAFPLGSTVSISLTNPAYIREFITNAQKYYVKDSNFYRLFHYTSTEVGLVFAEGTNWKSQRKMMSEGFHFEFIKNSMPIILQTTSEQLEKKIMKSQNQKELRFLAMKTFQNITGEVICRIFFGNTVANYSVQGKTLSKIMGEHLFFSSTNTFSLMNLLFGWRVFSLGLRTSDREFSRKAYVITNAIQELIDEAKTKLTESSSNYDHRILLHRFLKRALEGDIEISKEQIKMQFATLFGAGMDTTAHFLAIVFYYVVKYDFQSQLRSEVQQHINTDKDITVENLDKLDLMNIFIKESLRMGSPAQKVFHRVALEDNSILDIKVKKGTCLEFNLGFNFCNPSNFSEPEVFDPYRWKQIKLPDSFMFTPFSAGPRNCIGQHLAILETKAVLAYVLKYYDVQLEPGFKICMRQGMLYEPANDVPLILTRLT